MGHEWKLSKKQVDALARYFSANELLVECLKLAYVADREAILAGLLRPPQ